MSDLLWLGTVISISEKSQLCRFSVHKGATISPKRLISVESPVHPSLPRRVVAASTSGYPLNGLTSSIRKYETIFSTP